MIPTFIKYNADKYQRLGILKILVAILDPQRRSVSTEGINNKLSKLLFGKDKEGIRRAERLIQSSGSSSWNFRFTEETVKQIIDWGQFYGFIGAGNQITERGLLLRYLMGNDLAASISNGNDTVNPFELSPEEKIYFLFRQLELDAPLYYVIKRLADISEGEAISGIHADKITCHALYDTYLFLSNYRSFSGGLLSLKDLRGVIGRIISELKIAAEIPIEPIRKPPSASKLRAPTDQRHKKRTKTADHEAIPRFEFLTDIGFLHKNPPGKDTMNNDDYRKSWRYWITSLLPKYAKAIPENYDVSFCSTGFSRAAALIQQQEVVFISADTDPMRLALRSYEAYNIVKRVIGHTPIESVAIMAMIKGLVVHESFELKDVHDLFMRFKRDDLFSGSVRFAAGNDLDKMFIDIKPSFSDEVRKHYEK